MKTINIQGTVVVTCRADVDMTIQEDQIAAAVVNLTVAPEIDLKGLGGPIVSAHGTEELQIYLQGVATHAVLGAAARYLQKHVGIPPPSAGPIVLHLDKPAGDA